MSSTARNGMRTADCAISRLWTNWHSPDLIEVLPAAVYVCNADAVVVAYNRRAAELWGREPTLGDTDEKYCGAHRLFRPDGTFLPHRETPMEWVLRTGEPARDREVIIERPDGSRITVLVNIAPLFDEDEKLVGAVNCFQDLTVQKQAEQERTQLAEQLHQAKKLEALGQLTAGVVHDFNNLLTAILGNLELLKDVTSDEGSRQLLCNITRSAEQGAELNAQLLGFARKQTLLPKAIDLHQVLTGISDLLRATVGDLIRIEMRTQPNTWPVLVDPNQIALVALNLVINARDAMPCGGTVTIEMRNVTFGVGDCPDGLSGGDYVALSVSDTGTGMSEDVRAMAFEPFFTTKGPGEGSGLGLSMVRGVATQSGGGVRINSQPGSGTSIQVLLPRAGIEAFSAEMEAEASPHHSAAVREEVVLVVDDDRYVREATTAILASLGYRVVEVSNGPAAIEILARGERVDLMLVDIGMPGMNGIDAMRGAREQRPDLPVLFATGYADAMPFSNGDIDRNCLVGKPFRRDELFRRIQACMGEGHRRDTPVSE